MPLLYLLLKAAAFGLAVAAPVGPMSLLCMRRTLAQGWRQGLATGAGIATADGTYAALAAFGLAGLSGFLLANAAPLHLAAGLVLLWLGWRTAFHHAGEGAARGGEPISWPAAYAGSLALTLANPPTIITFAAIFAALVPAGGFDATLAGATVAGVFAGSLLWWCIVVGAVSAFRHAIGPAARRWIDRAAGAFLIGFGVLELARLWG
jgi:threonine/homoserine/homoserine lactone efflux protein